MKPRRGGFTLIELLVAMTVAATVLLLARVLFSATVDATSRVETVSAEAESDAAGRRWMDEAFRSLEIGRPGDAPFDGVTDAVRFTGYLWTPAGWPERSLIELRASTGRLLLAGDSIRPIVLRQNIKSASFDYLLDLGADARWVGAWHSPVSAPMAVRVRLVSASGVDTLLFVIGARG